MHRKAAKAARTSARKAEQVPQGLRDLGSSRRTCPLCSKGSLFDFVSGKQRTSIVIVYFEKMEEKKLNWRKATAVLMVMFLSCQMAACSKKENTDNRITSSAENTSGGAVSSAGENKGASLEEGQANGEWNDFTGQGYKISYPDTWEKQELSEDGFSISPKDLEDDDYTENVMVVTQDLSETGEDLEALKESVLEQFDSVEGFEQISCKETTLGGGKAYELIMKCSTDEVEFQSLQVFTVVGKTGYIFGFSGDNKGFEQYREDADKILKTFQFTEKAEETVED